MILAEAVDLVIARTGVQNYRRLCAEANPDRAQRDAYRSLVIRLARAAESPEGETLRSFEGHEVKRPPVRSLVLQRARISSPIPAELYTLIRDCPYRSKGKTGCECARCALKAGRKVTYETCVDCVKRYGV